MKGYIYKLERKLLYIIIMLTTCLSCSDSEEEQPESTVDKKDITVIFSTNGLGDMTYNDDLLTETMRFGRNHRDSINLHIVSPLSSGQGETAFKKWMAGATSDMQTKRLLVLASSEYETMLANADISLPEGNTILLLETQRKKWGKGVAGLDVKIYGISYIVGRMMASAGLSRAATMLAMPGDIKLMDGYKGLTEGLADGNQSGTLSDTFYLSDTANGYAMSDSAFKMAYKIAEERKYDFIYPLCGGSALGIYRYLNSRSHPLVIGMDGDCSSLNYFLPFSVIRGTGKILYENMEEWYNGGILPMHRSYGLEDGYSYIKNNTSHRQTHDWEKMGKIFMDEAVRKEKEYEEK